MGDGRMTEDDPIADADSGTGVLLRRAIDGDREAVDQLFARYLSRLRYLEQLDNAEISAVLGITVAAVRTRHCRALQRLHNLLSDDSIGSRT